MKMTTKPALTAALLVMALALILGVASGRLVGRTTPSGGQPAAAEAERRSKPIG